MAQLTETPECTVNPCPVPACPWNSILRYVSRHGRCKGDDGDAGSFSSYPRPGSRFEYRLHRRTDLLFILSFHLGAFMSTCIFPGLDHFLCGLVAVERAGDVSDQLRSSSDGLWQAKG